MAKVKRELSTSPPAGATSPPGAADSPSKKPKNSPSKAKGAAGDVEKRTGAWSGQELRQLYAIMCPKKVGVKWDDVCAQIPGRDAKACNNKWSRMQKNIELAVEAMGKGE